MDNTIAALSSYARFCVPLFLVISGYLHANSLQNATIDIHSIFKIIVKRFQRIMIPYFIFSILYLLIRIILEQFHFFQKVAPVKYQNFNSIFFAITLVKDNPAGHLYFLVLLFFTTVLFTISIAFFVKKRLLFLGFCVIITLLSYVWWGDIYRSINPLKGIGFYALGYFIYNNFPKKGIPFFLCTVFSLFAYIGGTFLTFKIKSNVLLFFVHATGAVAILFFSFALFSFIKTSIFKKTILLIGRNSFMIYLLHEPYIVTVLFISFFKIAGLNPYLSLLLTIVAGVLLPLIINKVILSKVVFFNKL